MATDPTEFNLVIDASALVAIALREPGYETLTDALVESSGTCVASPTMLEAAMVLSGRELSDPLPQLAQMLRDVDAVTVPFGDEHFRAAFGLFVKFGKGRHPAALNFGDCMSAGLASILGVPLLYVGDDFEKAGFKRMSKA